MQKAVLIVSLLLFFVAGLTACDSGAAIPAEATVAATPVSISTTPTVIATPTSAPPTATPTPSPTFTSTPIPPTSTPTPTSSPTPEPVVQVDDTLTTAVNVRSGPGTVYPVVARVAPGQEAAIMGRNATGDWWQIDLSGADASAAAGWVFGELVAFSGEKADVPVVTPSPPPPTPTPAPQPADSEDDSESLPPEELVDKLRCGKDFCVTYQELIPIWENGGCIGNHSIYVTVLEGLPPGRPMDGVVIGDTFNNIEVASGSKGPGTAEVTLWMNTMSLKVKRHIDGTPYTSEESFPFTAHDELIPAEVLAAAGYCNGDVEECRRAQQKNQICRGHYSWRLTFHKFD